MIHRDECKHCDHWNEVRPSAAKEQGVVRCCQCSRLALRELEQSEVRCIHGVLYPVHGMNGTGKEAEAA